MVVKEDLTDQRISIAVQPARGNPDQFVSDGDAGPVNELSILHNPNHKPGKIILPFFIKPRHFSCFTTDE